MALSRNSSGTHLPLDSKINSIKDNGGTEKQILNRINNILALDDVKEQKNGVTFDLPENTRLSLVKCQNDMLFKVYQEAMQGDDSTLMILLKKFFEHKLKMKYGETAPWFISFLKEYKKGQNRATYDSVFIRITDFEIKYMKICPILSIVLQLVFEGIDDACLKQDNVFDRLWLTITSDGLKSITKFSDYIIKNVMNEQLKKGSVLFQALREYFRGRVFSILKECYIGDKGNLYSLALDDVVMNGWSADMKPIQEQLTPNSYKILLAKLQSLRQDNFMWSRIGCNGCYMLPLVGKRYHCEICDNYDLCFQCQAKGHPHQLILLPVPRADGNNDDVQKNSTNENKPKKMKENNKKQGQNDGETKKKNNTKDNSKKQIGRKSDTEESVAALCSSSTSESGEDEAAEKGTEESDVKKFHDKKQGKEMQDAKKQSMKKNDNRNQLVQKHHIEEKEILEQISKKQSSKGSQNGEDDMKKQDNKNQPKGKDNNEQEDIWDNSEQEYSEPLWSVEKDSISEYDQQEENEKLDNAKDDNKSQCSGKDCHEIKDEQKDDSEQIKSTATWKGRAGFTAIQNACQQEALQLHNTYRTRHGVPSLALDDTISRKAQQYADYLAKTDQLNNSIDLAGLGENLFTVSNCEPDEPTGLGTKATESWYSEIKSYDFQRPSFSASTAHFSQLIWKSTKKLGIGIGFADGGRKATIVARYEPAGNVKEDFQHNVSAPIHS